ncbi:hypothetical protein Poli38472_012590 [Pythium oligandrum]|uniref:FYVE-type domain-containing protein n=1 Tax=Pythium oligandrum TaxID=41045 RepID=A0A8K1CE63_PYTOL|nr:hypothetical protein Poli38472_012590 [Pythium oligandrum]|eukprot:TMW61399.1 hypothetical protein Poli38472_012590 [Pythium oligandrum]
MKRQLSAQSAYHSLELSPGEEQNVIVDVASILHRTLALEAEFRRQGSQVNHKQWKKVNSIDDFHVYKQRKMANNDPQRETFVEEDISAPQLMSMREHLSKRSSEISLFPDDLEHTTTSTISSGSSNCDESHVPNIMCSGMVDGRLEDFMYGVYDGDDMAWKVRTAYIKDKFADARILATIRAPTHDDPFRFLGIKWFSTEYPPLVGTFIQKRDVLVMEATGIAKDDNGVPFGYYVMHDFHHPRLPERKDLGVVRIKFNLCFINRQIKPDRIGQYARGHVDFGGELPASMGVSITAISLASTANSVETAYLKKLAWLMTQQQSQRRMTHDRHAPRAPSVCHSCQKSSSGILSRGLTNCHVCSQPFCSKCTVEKKLVVDTIATQLTLKPLSFCFGCVLKAKQLHPVEMARATNVHHR